MHTIAGAAVLVMALAGCKDEDAAKPEGAAPGNDPSSSAPANPDQPAAGQPGESDSAEAPAQPGDPGQPDDSAGKPMPEGVKLPPPQIEASTGLPQGHPKEALVDGSKLIIRAQESGCEKATAELGKQTADAVTVTLVRTQPKEKMMCTMDIRYPPLTVELDDPIGKRTLILKGESRYE